MFGPLLVDVEVALGIEFLSEMEQFRQVEDNRQKSVLRGCDCNPCHSKSGAFCVYVLNVARTNE